MKTFSLQILFHPATVHACWCPFRRLGEGVGAGRKEDPTSRDVGVSVCLHGLRRGSPDRTGVRPGHVWTSGVFWVGQSGVPPEVSPGSHPVSQSMVGVVLLFEDYLLCPETTTPSFCLFDFRVSVVPLRDLDVSSPDVGRPLPRVWYVPSTLYPLFDTETESRVLNVLVVSPSRPSGSTRRVPGGTCPFQSTGTETSPGVSRSSRCD